jgi:hypothetical protein
MSDIKQATIYLDSHVHRRLKIRAAEQGKTLSTLVSEAVASLLADDGSSGERTRAGLHLEWAGALADLKDEKTSLELQELGKN